MNINMMEKPKKNISDDIKVTCSSDIVKIKDVQEIRNAVREHLLFIGLDIKNNIRNITLLGVGTSCDVVIDSKEIIRTALFSASDNVVLVHNHPSNDLEPSKADIHLTNVTNEMLKVFNIKLLDHIIVTEKDYISIDKIQKISKEKNIDVIDNLEKALLIEENQKLKQQIEELRMSNIELKINVISAKYVGSYNDTTVYNVEISLNGEKEFVTLERKYEDMKSKYKWEIFSNFNLKERYVDDVRSLFKW